MGKVCAKRRILFMQGPGSFFFNNLAKHFNKIGHKSYKINLCAGDALFWNAGNVTHYRERFENWQDFIHDYLVNNQITDIVLFSDSRPYHWVASRTADKLGINMFVFENGYFRPDWITMEHGGVNGRSPFPRNQDAIEALAAQLPSRDLPKTQQINYSNRVLIGDIAFHTVNYVASLLYPHYCRFRTPHPVRETIGWALKGLKWSKSSKRSKVRLAQLFDSGKKFYFYPLQLDHDFQLMVDSSFSTITQASEYILRSFAENAPKDVQLLVKNHPRDNNIINREHDIKRLAAKYGISDRVFFIECGSNPEILKHTAGVVTINSTMGTSALLRGLPLCALGAAVYDIKGLTHKTGLHNFWTSPKVPEKAFFEKFHSTLIAQSLVHGEFGDPNKNAPALSKCADKVLATEIKINMRQPQINLQAAPVQVQEAPILDVQLTCTEGERSRNAA